MKRITILLIILLSLSACSKSTKNTELIWRISQNEISEETEIKINERLLELGKNVTINFVSDTSIGDPLDSSEETEEVIVDIEAFRQDKIDKYEALDFSLLEKYYTKATSKAVLKNGEALVIPNGLVLGVYNSITVEESFANRNNIQQSQLEGSLLDIYTELSSYLDKNESMEVDPFYLFMPMLRDRYMAIDFSTYYSYGPFIDLETNKVVDLFSIPEWEELKDVYYYIRENNLDRLNEDDEFTNILYTIQDYDSPYENQNTVSSVKSKKYISSVSGVSILKESKHKSLAQDVLDTIYSDEELSTLIKYGVENVDYKILEGRIHDERQYNFETTIGTSGLGNGFVLKPNRLEPENKLDTAEKHDADAIFNPEIGFISSYDITNYHEAVSEVLYKLRVEGSINEASIPDSSEIIPEIQRELEDFYVKLED